MPDENPFKTAYDPMGTGSVTVIKCPVCASRNFTANSNQYGVHRTCKDCKNQWSGGGIGSFPEGQPFISETAMLEDDQPLEQYTGANFRDPNKNFGREE